MTDTSKVYDNDSIWQCPHCREFVDKKWLDPMNRHPRCVTDGREGDVAIEYVPAILLTTEIASHQETSKCYEDAKELITAERKLAEEAKETAETHIIEGNRQWLVERFGTDEIQDDDTLPSIVVRFFREREAALLRVDKLRREVPHCKKMVEVTESMLSNGYPVICNKKLVCPDCDKED